MDEENIYLKRLLLLQANFIAVYLLNEIEEKKLWANRRWIVRPINTKRKYIGYFYTLFQELKEDQDMFFKVTRMDVPTFNYLKNYLFLYLFKPRSNILPEERLALTLRFLSTGDCINSITLDYRVGVSTCYGIIADTCKVIFDKLSPIYWRVPTEEEWKSIDCGFLNDWNLPNCCGAIDGKHKHIKAPANSGSVYFNYKKTFNLVLLAVCNHEYEFVLFDVGAVDSESDGGILARSELGKAFREKYLNLPQNCEKLPGTENEVPYYFVSDAAFELSQNLLKPFPGRNLDERKRIFNYRLSRARRVIENTFGNLVSRWQYLQKPLGFHPNTVINCVLASTKLHNFLMSSTNRRNIYCTSEFIDKENNSGFLLNGQLRREPNSADVLQDLNNIELNMEVLNAHTIRNNLADYVLTTAGEMPWQYEYVRSGSYQDIS